MSLALADAKVEIARVVGAASVPNKVALAGTAIEVTAKKWSNRHDWEYLRKDNSVARTITGCNLADTGITGISTAGLNVGQVVTGSGLPANVTIQSIPNATSAVVSSTGVTNASIDLTFSAYIPVRAGTSYYYLPHDFKNLYTARLLTSKRWLEVKRDREIDREFPDQESNQSAVSIAPASPGDGTGFTASDQRARCRLIGPPDTNENMLVKYYRTIDGLADPLDIPDDFIFAFLDSCKAWFLSQVNSSDPRLDYLTGFAERGLAAVIAQDTEIPDEDVRMKSQMEIMNSQIVERGYPVRDI